MSGRAPRNVGAGVGLTLAMLLLCVAAARPVLEVRRRQRPPASRTGLAPNVFLIVDRSPDMQVADQPGGRPAWRAPARTSLALVDRFPDARIAVISFGSRSTLQWPLSADTWSLRPSLAAFEPYASAPGRGGPDQRGRGGKHVALSADRRQTAVPGWRKNLVYYLGAGAAEAREPPRDFNLPDRAVDGGAVLGYGTPAGGPIPGHRRRAFGDRRAGPAGHRRTDRGALRRRGRRRAARRTRCPRGPPIPGHAAARSDGSGPRRAVLGPGEPWRRCWCSSSCTWCCANSAGRG